MGGYIIGDQAYVTCDDCGKPITVVTEIGMFCEDLCGIEESKKAGKQIDALIEKLLKGLEEGKTIEGIGGNL